MNINGIQKSITPVLKNTRLKRRLFEMLPNITIKDFPKVGEFGNIINRPDVNRGIMGATAILTQPFIDKHNPDVDKETAEISMYRTIGKILAGTTVGCMVRMGVYHLVDTCTSVNPSDPKWRKSLMPSRRTLKKLSSHNVDWFKNYKNVLATSLGLAVMLGTNFLLDVPLTSFITKKLMDFKKWRESKEGKVAK